MFCEECGAKLKKGDLFCEKCGAKVKGTEEPTKKVVKKVSTKKPISKKNKIIIGIVVVLLIALIAGYKVLSTKYSPKQVAKDYIEAVINKDASKLYSYVELDGDKTFVSKKAFEKAMESSSYSAEIENYNITNVTYGDSKLSAKVTFTYTTKTSSGEKTDTINLTKEKGKTLLVFDTWKVSDLSTDSMVVEDYEISVPKNAAVTFNDIKVDKKYLDSDESTDTLDVYVLPQVFSVKSEIKVKLSNGIELTDTTTPSSYYDYYKVSFNLDNLSDSDIESITTAYTNSITALYQAGIEQKSWDDVKESYAKDGIDTSDLETTYQEFIDELKNAYSKLTAIEFTNVELSGVSLDEDGYLIVKAKVNYNYSIEYTSLDETKTKESKDYSYMTLTYSMDDDGYSLVDASNLVTYFSRY